MAADTFGVNRGGIHNWFNAYTHDDLVDDTRPCPLLFVWHAKLENIVGSIKHFIAYELVELVESPMCSETRAPSVGIAGFQG